MRLALNAFTGLLEIPQPFLIADRPRENRENASEPDDKAPFIPSRAVRERKRLKALDKIRQSASKAKPLRPDAKRLTSRQLDPVHPGEILREDFMKPCELTVTDLARHLRMRAEALKPVISCKRPVTAEIALRLSRYFGTSADVWLLLQTRYDLEKAQDSMLEEVTREIAPRDAT